MFLDEIGDLPRKVQVKLLRFLDTGEYRRVGDVTTRRANVRVIAATNVDIDQLVASGQFRQDLLFRLNVFRIQVPPLRDRRSDIVPLAEIFLRAESRSRLPLAVSPSVKAWLLSYHWPGNVRELRNLCEYFAARAWGKDSVGIEDLPSELRHKTLPSATDSAGQSLYLKEREALERAQIARALAETEGHISRAAELLGLGRNTVARKMRDYGLARSGFTSRGKKQDSPHSKS